MAFDYWEEAVGEGLCEAGIWPLTTKEQREKLTKFIKSAASMESESMGYLDIPNPQTREIKVLEEKLDYERQAHQAYKEVLAYIGKLNVNQRLELNEHFEIEVR